MEGKRLRIRAARLLAVVYVMYVVMSGMTIPGVDGKLRPLLIAKAANNVKVTNSTTLSSARIGSVSATALSDKNVTYFTLTKHVNADFSSDKYTYNIYSVKYNGKDYYYDPTNKEDKEGLFYSDDKGKWGFVFPQSATSFEVQVQLAVNFWASKKSISIYNAGFNSSAAVGGYEQISSEILGTNLDTAGLTLQYFDYEGNTTAKSISCSSSGVFNTSNLRFCCLTEEDNHFTYRIQYGGMCFGVGEDINTPAVLQMWKTSSPKATAYRQPGTNRYVVDTNIENPETKIKFTYYKWPPEEDGLVISKEITGKDITFPEKGIYMPGWVLEDELFDDYKDYCGVGTISVSNSNSQNATSQASLQWYGPKKSLLGTLEAGTSKNITEKLTDVKNNSSDYAGNVIKVGSTTVTEDTPYEDAYVTIDYYGNVTAKSASGSSKTYKLTTQTKYTKMAKTTVSSLGGDVLGYADASGNFSETPTEQYGTQNWPVTLTVTTTGSSTTEATTTTEPTTAAPATYKATLSTKNSQTKIASGNKIATGDNGSITLEAGQTVTVTPGSSTYGSTVTVSDSATTVTKNNNGTYTFKMPAKAITVTVTDITLSSISATITGAGKAAASPYAFGEKTAQPTDTEIINACKQSNLSITATLSNNTIKSITASEASYSVTSNTLGTPASSDTTITYPGTAVITVAYGGKSTTVNYYYTYTTSNQRTLESISIAAKPGSISTNINAPTKYETKSALPSNTVIESQIEKITATYKDSLGKTSTETIDSTATGLSLKVITPEENVSVKDEVHTHAYTSQVTATYNGKTSNIVTFYYQYQNYSVTCKTVDEAGKSIPSSLNATVSSTTDVEKGTKITITTPEDESLSYLMTKISVIGMSTKKDYSNTVSNKTFTMPGEPVTVTVTYTKLSDYTVTPPTKTKLDTAPTQTELNSLLSGASLLPKYQSTTGTRVNLPSNLVTVSLGKPTDVFENGVTTYTVPVTVEFKGITKENAFSFTYEVKQSYTASVVQAAGPSVQIKKGNGAYTSSVSGYYGDTITVKVPAETQEYAFPTVTVKSKAGTTIKTITQPGDVTFTMPAEHVTVTANYQRLTELKVTPPDTSKENYSQNTTKADLLLGTIDAVYGSSSQTKSINMTTDMYTLGEHTETTTENGDGSKTIKVIVPVTIHVVYGGLEEDKTFSYSYSYNVSKDSKEIRIGAVTCGAKVLDNSGLVMVSPSVADKDSEIRVTVKETPEYAFPSVVVRTTSGTEIETLTLSGTGDEKTATFTMPGEDVKIDVDYKSLTSITLTKPKKTQYDHYTKPEDLDLTGGSLKVSYGTSSADVKTIALKTDAGVSNGCTLTCTKGTDTEKDGVRVIPVTVSITYGGETVSYEYTYEEISTYSVTLDKSALPEDFVNKEKVSLSTTIGNYGDELILYLPADTDDMYAFPTVTVKQGTETKVWEPKNGAYKTEITDDMVVSVSYCKLGKLLLTLPTTAVYVGTSLASIDALDTSKVKLELVYYNGEDEGGRRPIPVKGNTKFEYDKETESVTNGKCTHTVPVHVTANYKNLVKTEGSYSVWYNNYVVSAQDVDGNSLPVDKNKANAGDTITISLTSGLDVKRIRANNTSVGYELSEDKTKAVIVLKTDMLDDKTGYTFVVAYQTIQSIKAPENAVVVSDKIMKEEELKTALADLSSFDFGTASILVSYNELEPNTEILLSSSSVTKKLLENKTTEKESADGTYIERTYFIEATVGGKSVEIPIMVKVEKGSSASGEATKNPGENTGGNSSGDADKKDDEKKDDDKVVTTTTKPDKVTGAKVAAKNRKLTVTWKAADNATAYEIWISTKKNGGYLKAATVKNSGSKKTYSYTVKQLDGSKLKKGKTYYVKVRAVNVKSKLVTKTINQTAKSKKNRRLYVTVKSVKNAVSYTVKASTKKKGGYKTIFKFDEIGKKKYTKYIKHQKRNTKYYIKVEVKVETGKRYEGSYSSAVKVKCK